MIGTKNSRSGYGRGMRGVAAGERRHPCGLMGYNFQQLSPFELCHEGRRAGGPRYVARQRETTSFFFSSTGLVTVTKFLWSPDLEKRNWHMTRFSPAWTRLPMW